MAAKKATARKVSRPAKKTVATKKKVVTKKPARKQTVAKKPAKKAITKKVIRKAVAKKAAARPAVKPKVAARKAAPVAAPVPQPTIAPNRISWVDELTQTPLIDDYAQQLESFLSAMADGRVEETEVQRQEQRVVALLKEVDPQIADPLHARVTQLLCELTAYAVMQTLYALEQSRPKTVFQG